jgi:hexosaminidase
MRPRILALLVALAACTKSPAAPVPPVKATAQTPQKSVGLLPRARSTASCAGSLAIDASTKIAADPAVRPVAEQLAGWLGLGKGAIANEGAVQLVLANEISGDEAYKLEVSPAHAVVRAKAAAGLFYGAQALAQLAGARRVGSDTPAGRWTVPCLTIEDAPRVPFRAMHLDVSRHFFSRQVVERYIDLLAFYRFNVFHWHLTDDQGFRFEVKSHPELTAIGGRDGFYTQDEMRAVVAHARDRAITIIPEIEMPGHARAVLAAHPELSCTGKKQDVPRTWGVFDDVLCAGNEQTYALITDVLGEVAKVFPSKLIHVGGDEVPTKRWAECPKCRAAMAKSKVPVTSLEGVFMQRVSTILAGLGRKPVVWDDALGDLLAKDAVVVAWQGKERGRAAADHGHDVVMAPYQHVYFNTHQSRTHDEPGQVGFLPWTKVRVFDPLPEGLEPAKAPHIVGGEGAIWTEYIETPEQLETMAMPRMAALSEALWSGPAESEADFVARFGAQLPMLDASHVHYFVDAPLGLPDLPERKVIMGNEKVTLSPSVPALFPQGVVRWAPGDTDPAPASPLFDKPMTISETTSFRSALFLPGGRQSPILRSTVVKEAPRRAVTVAKPEPGVNYMYAEDLFYKLPSFDEVGVKARGRASGIGIAEVKKKTPVRDERFALRFDGFVQVPSDGVYRFVARADDGVRLELDGEALFEDDGEHDARESFAQIALASGFHRVRVTYFQGSEHSALEVKMEGPGVASGPVAMFVDASAR